MERIFQYIFFACVVRWKRAVGVVGMCICVGCAKNKSDLVHDILFAHVVASSLDRGIYDGGLSVFEDHIVTDLSVEIRGFSYTIVEDRGDGDGSLLVGGSDAGPREQVAGVCADCRSVFCSVYSLSDCF